MKKGDFVRLVDAEGTGRYEGVGIVAGDVGIVTKVDSDLNEVYCSVAFFRVGYGIGGMLTSRYEVVGEADA